MEMTWVTLPMEGLIEVALEVGLQVQTGYTI